MPWFRGFPKLGATLSPADRLEMGVHLLAVIDVNRERLGDDFDRQGLVDAVLRRELEELEADYRRDPPRGMVPR